MTREDMVQHIDRVADHIRAVLVGDPVRAFEYQAAEQQARAFKAAMYLGAVPPTVQAWMDARSFTAKVATDDIIREADQYHAALHHIRAERLKGKYAVQGAADEGLAEAAYQAAITAIKSVV